MLKKYSFVLALLCVSTTLFSQNTSIKWLDAIDAKKFDQQHIVGDELVAIVSSKKGYSIERRNKVNQNLIQPFKEFSLPNIEGKTPKIENFFSVEDQLYIVAYFGKEGVSTFNKTVFLFSLNKDGSCADSPLESLMLKVQFGNVAQIIQNDSTKQALILIQGMLNETQEYGFISLNKKATKSGILTFTSAQKGTFENMVVTTSIIDEKKIYMLCTVQKPKEFRDTKKVEYYGKSETQQMLYTYSFDSKKMDEQPLLKDNQYISSAALSFDASGKVTVVGFYGIKDQGPLKGYFNLELDESTKIVSSLFKDLDPGLKSQLAKIGNPEDYKMTLRYEGFADDGSRILVFENFTTFIASNGTVSSGIVCSGRIYVMKVSKTELNLSSIYRYASLAESVFLSFFTLEKNKTLYFIFNDTPKNEKVTDVSQISDNAGMTVASGAILVQVKVDMNNIANIKRETILNSAEQQFYPHTMAALLKIAPNRYLINGNKSVEYKVGELSF